MSCAAWVYLVFFHGGFWRSTLSANELPNPDLPEWPDVLVVIPARNEADVISRTVLSLQQQDYSRPVSIVLVDDNSNDGTAAIARAAAAEAGHADRLAFGGLALELQDDRVVDRGVVGDLLVVGVVVVLVDDLPLVRHCFFRANGGGTANATNAERAGGIAVSSTQPIHHRGRES